MSNTKSYAQLASLTITGRISHVELVEGKYGEFLAFTLLTELQDDAESIAVKFNLGDGQLRGLFDKGFLNNGRRMTVQGHLKGFTELYFDKKAGKTKRLQRPRLDLDYVMVQPGCLGPAKKQEQAMADEDLDLDGPTVDPTPSLVGSTDEINF